MHSEGNNSSRFVIYYVALNETIKIMQEIDDVIEQHGGWLGAFLVNKSCSA
jgi:hypothetical protein